MASNGIIYLNIFSLLILLILSIIFFTKERLHKTEDNLYGKVLIYSVCANFFGILFGFLMETEYINTNITLLSNKLYLIFLIITLLTFAFYTFSISKLKHQHFSSAKIIYNIMIITSVILLLTLPVKLINDNGTLSIDGPALYFTAFDFIIIYLCLLTLLIADYKNIKNKKYIPIILLLLVGIVIVILQVIYPNANYIINPSISLTVLIMYFTIENPDVKMVEELYKNKRIIEKTNEETSNLLFKISQDIKNPVKQIIDITNNEDNQKLKEINNLGKNLDYVIDDVLDVTKMTSKDLKIYNTKYNPKNLFNELKAKTENELNTNNVKLEFKLNENIPEYVYGDAINLKQILNTILENSIKNTTKGFIEFEVNTIIKYGTCRFIIDISDTSSGISIDKVNEILSLKETINEDETIKNLKQVKSLITRLGGGFMLKSEEGKGTTISITLDQKIFETEEINQKLDKYETSIIKNKRVMLVDDDAKELADITNLLEENNIIVNSSLFGQDIIEKINNNYKFDLIILDDETNTYSALTVLKELQKNEKFNIPVIVMINSNKESITKHYLQDGFTDIIKKENLKEELKRIIQKN